MTPIEGLTDSLRLPRLGKIRLGIKVEGKTSTYPKAVDYFVCPPEVQKVFGEKPKELRILLPTENADEFASTWYRAYSFRGLVCKGDGQTAHRQVDLGLAVNKETGELPTGNMPQDWPMATARSEKVDWRDITCPGKECPDFGARGCRPIMNLQFLLPDVPGLGVWQLDTSSMNSIGNLLGAVKLIRGLLGKVAMIPLTLAVEPKEVQPPGLPKKTVWVLNLRAPNKLSDLVAFAALPAGQVLLPEPDREAPDDLVPEEVIAQTEARQIAPPPEPKPVVHTGEVIPPTPRRAPVAPQDAPEAVSQPSAVSKPTEARQTATAKPLAPQPVDGKGFLAATEAQGIPAKVVTEFCKGMKAADYIKLHNITWAILLAQVVTYSTGGRLMASDPNASPFPPAQQGKE